MKNTTRNLLRGGVAPVALGFAMLATPAMAQESIADDTAASTANEGVIIVTGTRISRPNMELASPVATVDGEASTEFADITLDSFVNLLPQVNPSSGPTSNNPGNGGQSNINLRGLGSNRNLVLIDGRRPMVSASNLTVDLNTIPQGLIERIDVITGGAGAVYGADAIAGVVNLVLKDDFEGVDLTASYSNATENWDAEEYRISGVIGGNFADGRGNAVIAVDYAEREPLIKSQRAFSVFATSTTSFLPDGAYFESGNAAPQAVYDQVFGQYGVAPGAVPSGAGLIGFNPDGTLFSKGVFNSPLDVQNFTGPVDFSVNQALFPDLYSYNFDEVNLLVLPFDRTSVMAKANYEIAPIAEAFFQGGYTRTTSATALAPTPFPTVITTAPGENTSIQATSPFVESGSTVAFSLVIPATNPFIPADLKTLLDARTGDNTSLVGSGADEPILFRQRSLDVGLRQSEITTEVFQMLGGFRGDIGDRVSYELSYSFGRTNIDQLQTGNLDTNRVYDLINAPDGGVSICDGGLNVFGRQGISDDCVQYLEATGLLRREFIQKIFQGYVNAELAELPAGDLIVVVGAEKRDFEYELDPGTSSGPISGFNAQTPDAGENSFTDIFGELSIPILAGAPMADQLILTLGYRTSKSEFTDLINAVESPGRWDDAYKAELLWGINPDINVRASYQRSVRAPNFGELFSGGGSAPQIFDPCSITTAFRANGGADARQLCEDTGINAPDVFVQSPGTQASVTLSGNTDLGPETADTYTFGVAFANGGGLIPGLSGSIDYYKIDISDTIQSPDSNTIIADCYNFYGNNPNLSADFIPCQQIRRSGTDIRGINGLSATGEVQNAYPGVNGGSLSTSGIDLQLAYGLNPGITSEDRLTFNLLVNYLIDFKQQVLPAQPELDYAGTVGFFGAGFGQSFPEWKAFLNMQYSTDWFGWQVRTRFIDGMENRAAVIFPGEDASFSGTGSAVYVDTAFDISVLDPVSFRVGVNNVFDRGPELYAPNQQSGTDPSLYDVIGRRVFFQANVNF